MTPFYCCVGTCSTCLYAWLNQWYLSASLQRQNTEISKQIFPEGEFRGLGPSFHIHASVSDLYIATIGMPILLEEICRLILGLYKSLTAHECWNWAEAALFPEKEYMSGIFVAVYHVTSLVLFRYMFHPFILAIVHIGDVCALVSLTLHYCCLGTCCIRLSVWLPWWCSCAVQL